METAARLPPQRGIIRLFPVAQSWKRWLLAGRRKRRLAPSADHANKAAMAVWSVAEATPELAAASLATLAARVCV